MSLTFDEYQKRALSTAVYPRQYVLMAGEVIKQNSPSCIYPVFGLCGEIGEVADVTANILGTQIDLIKECGDVLWYIAAICSDLSINMRDVAGCDSFAAFGNQNILTSNAHVHEIVRELFIAAGIIAEATKKTIRDSNGVMTKERLAIIQTALKRILVALKSLCTLHGILFTGVPQSNLDKLAARAAKGTISGNGDNR